MFKTLDFDWSSLKVVLEGSSVIDTPKLNCPSKALAKQFLLSYGYDIDDLLVREEIWRIYFQSIAFIQDQLLEVGEKIPDELLSRGASSDILKLLVEASNNQSGRSVFAPGTQKLSNKTLIGKWACAILRVMHIISHLDNDVRGENFQFARSQIFDRFDKFVQPAGPRRWKFQFEDKSVSLVRYIKKERKERNSILIKLLSKPLSFVEEIYDRIGFRFVTENRFDAYNLLQLLIESGGLNIANVQPGRSNNALIPYDALFQTVTETQRQLERGEISVRVARRAIQKLEEEHHVSLGLARNPLSSRWYRSIQFTGRQLISAPDPAFKFWEDLQNRLPKNAAIRNEIKKIPISLREKRTFYYPFEIQIMDVESYVESIGGRSRHREYKDKQRLMARNRVLRDLV
jgi:uncharacterized protein (TIGR04562 family)